MNQQHMHHPECIDIMIQFVPSTESETQGSDGEVHSPGSALSYITLSKEHNIIYVCTINIIFLILRFKHY